MYKQKVSPLVTRPALFLYSHVTSALNLLEHAIWAFNKAEPSAALDAEVFRRWVEEGAWGGCVSTVAEEVKRALEVSGSRAEIDIELVYGEEGQAKDGVVELARAHL